MLGFALGEHHDARNAYGALAMAVAVRGGAVPGVILHTDQGGEFTAGLFRAACERLNSRDIPRVWQATKKMRQARSAPHPRIDRVVPEDGIAAERLHRGKEGSCMDWREQPGRAARVHHHRLSAATGWRPGWALHRGTLSPEDRRTWLSSTGFGSVNRKSARPPRD